MWLCSSICRHIRGDACQTSLLPLRLPSPPLPHLLYKFLARIVLRALCSFPHGSAPGLSSVRASHLMEAVYCPSPNRSSSALQGLVRVVNLLSRGCVAPSVLPHLCGATLIACKKKAGGLRFIVVGEVLRQLISKCISCSVHSEATGYLSPLQVDGGIPCGCEAFIHSVRDISNDGSISSDSKFLLLVDFSNAFNSINIKCMFKEAHRRIPSLSAWLERCYRSQSLLHFGDTKIPSCCGVQQGDPLGPLGFSLILQPVIERIEREVPDLLLNVWYLYDGTLCDSLYRALNIIEEEGPSWGLYLNLSKFHSFLSTPRRGPFF